MKKSKNFKLILNKKTISKLNQSAIKGGTGITGVHTCGPVCMSGAPHSYRPNCNDAPSQFGDGGTCDYEQER